MRLWSGVAIAQGRNFQEGTEVPESGERDPNSSFRISQIHLDEAQKLRSER